MRTKIVKLAAAVAFAAVIFLIVSKTYKGFSEVSISKLSSADLPITRGSAPHTAALVGKQVMSPSPTVPIAGSTAAYNTTYRPQSPRPYRQFSGAVDPNGIVDRRVPGWWLYAKSEAEASWLDHYGFPTAAEESRLSKSTDAELDVLVANGDLNAKAHQAARLAKLIFANGNTAKAGVATAMLEQTMGDGGGPYQAFTVYRTYSELLETYAYLPEGERTAEKRAVLNQYEATARLAFAFGTALGDEMMLVQANTSMTKEAAGLGKAKEFSGVQFANTLAAIARRRTDQGLPAITIIPRPSAPGATPQNDGAIILERY